MSVFKWKMAQCLTISFFVSIFLNVNVCGDEKLADLKELIKIAKLLQIEIISDNHIFPIKTTYGPIDGKNTDKKSIENYALILVPEISLYSPSMIKKMRIKRIVFCVNLSYDGQLRGAIPDFEHDTLYLDVARGADNKEYQREAFHHELFHIIDWLDDGDLYKDDLWSALNPKSFKYGTGGKNAQDNPNTGVLTDKYPGFLNHYSTTGVEEDKAEIFAKMMVEPAYISEIIKKDKVLAAKTEKMKSLTLAFNTEMDKSFWEKTKKLVRAK
jgi:hypothetical protein